MTCAVTVFFQPSQLTTSRPPDMQKMNASIAQWIQETQKFKLGTPTPWLTLLLVLGKSRVKQNSC